jgi:glutamine---fructose-6-phosphate transaminase (isomerizing)
VLPDLSIIEGRYLQDLVSQPQALDATLQGLQDLRDVRKLATDLQRKKFERIVLTGMGSSFHGLYPLSLQLVGHGFTALMVETSELVHYKSRLFGPETLIVAGSQSGRSAEVVRLLDINRKRSPVIAVSNTADSPLARRADALVLTHAGDEFSVSCKTYIAGLMALKSVGDILCDVPAQRTKQQLAVAAPAVSTYLARWQEHVHFLCRELIGIEHLFLVGRGPSLAAVSTGALIIKEAAHFHAEGMSSAAFRHGPLEMLSKETFVLVFSGDQKTQDLNLKLLQDIQEHRGKAQMISESGLSPTFCVPAVPVGIRPIVEILPVQMITLALAARVGREPGRFEWASKVTTTE